MLSLHKKLSFKTDDMYLLFTLCLTRRERRKKKHLKKPRKKPALKQKKHKPKLDSETI